MKKILNLILALLILMTSLPVMAAEGPVYNKEVTFVGQWVGESSSKKDTLKTFSSGDDKLGNPEANGGLLRGLAKQFLGWSNVPLSSNDDINKLVKDGETDKKLTIKEFIKKYEDKPEYDNIPNYLKDSEEEVRIFSPESKISDVFPNGIPNDAKIYGVYFELNKPFGDPFPANPLSQLAVANIADEMKAWINDNKVMINAELKDEEILKGTENKSGEEKDGVRTIIDYYKEGDDKEVVLKSKFKMQPIISLLTYNNMHGSNALRPIFSYDYNTRHEKNDFPLKDGKDSGYTYVDLTMNFGDDEGLVIPEKLFLEFRSYSWRPLYAYVEKSDNPGDKQLLDLYDGQGNNIGDIIKYGSGIVGQSVGTKFGVNTKIGDKQYRIITIRVILREWDKIKKSNEPFSGERIPKSMITSDTGKSMAEIVAENNMELNVLGSADGIGKDSIVKISDKRAKELADKNATEKINISGSIKGHAFTSAGVVSQFGIDFPLSSDTSIGKSEANPSLSLSYINEPKPEPKPEPIPEEPVIVFKPHEYVETHPVNAIIRDEILEELIHEKYIFGYPEDIIKPDGNMTRAEAVSVVARLEKLKLEDEKEIFKDTKAGAWYNKALNAAYKAGYLEEKEGDNFRPNEQITRAELAQLISHIDKKNEKIAPFEDIKGHKYEKAINMAYGNGRIKGYPDGSFKPDKEITRAEVASMLNKLYNRYPDKNFIDANPNKIHSYKDLEKTHWAYYELVEAYETHKYHRLANNMEEWIDIIK